MRAGGGVGRQRAANAAVKTGALDYDRKYGYRGPEAFVDLSPDPQKAEDQIDAALDGGRHDLGRRADLGPGQRERGDVADRPRHRRGHHRLVVELHRAHGVARRRERHDDLAVETAGTEQGRVEHIGAVCGRDNDDPLIGLEAVHLDEQLVERLFPLIIAIAKAGTAMTAHGVDFIDENDARRRFLRLVKHVAHAACADADEHFDKVRARNREEWHIGFTGDGTCKQRLARARRADK